MHSIARQKRLDETFSFRTDRQAMTLPLKSRGVSTQQWGVVYRLRFYVPGTTFCVF